MTLKGALRDNTKNGCVGDYTKARTTLTDLWFDSCIAKS